MATVEGAEAANSNRTEPTEKIICLLKAAGGAPILTKQRVAFPRTTTLRAIATSLRNILKLSEDTPLLLYVNQAFAPALDTALGSLYDCFRSDKTLVLNYALTPAWG